jgi:hypothetical protein
MASTPNRISRRNAPRRPEGRRRSHTKSFTSPKSPQSILAQARRNSLTSRRGRGGLFGAGSSNRFKRAEGKVGDRTWKYSKFGLLPRTTEPFEKVRVLLSCAYMCCVAIKMLSLDPLFSLQLLAYTRITPH